MSKQKPRQMTKDQRKPNKRNTCTDKIRNKNRENKKQENNWTNKRIPRQKKKKKFNKTKKQKQNAN